MWNMLREAAKKLNLAMPSGLLISLPAVARRSGRPAPEIVAISLAGDMILSKKTKNHKNQKNHKKPLSCIVPLDIMLGRLSAVSKKITAHLGFIIHLVSL